MAGTDDRLWLDGRIFTGRELIEAMLVEDGRVRALGSEAEVLRDRPTGAVIERLGGRLVLPAFIDSHVHILESSVRFGGVDLSGVADWAEFEARLRVWTMHHPVGPVLGGGWDHERLPSPGWPSREFLDRVVGDRPALLDRICEHVTVANSAALESAGVDRSLPDPPGGRIGRHSSGEPNGLLFDNAIRWTIPLREQWAQNHRTTIREMLGRWAGLGLAAVGAMSVRPAEWRMLEQLDREEPLPLRVRGYLRLDRWRPGAHPRPRDGEERVALRGVKASMDGALGSRTAWLREPYDDAAGERGLRIWEPGELGEGLRAAAGEGFGIALHAIGDRALAQALDALEELGHPPGSRIEHASVAPPDLRSRLARDRVTTVIQPEFRSSDWWLVQRIGRARAVECYPFRELLDSGVPVAGSSDSPVESIDPWPALRSLLEPPRFGSAPGTFSPGEALSLYTDAGARALGLPQLGGLVPGGPADFLVLESPTWEFALRSERCPMSSVWSGGRSRSGARGPPVRSA